MAYREDPDLRFLRKSDTADLGILVEYLTKDKDGSGRYTEELTGTDNYKEFYPRHRRYWKEIAAEVQCFGGNSFVTNLVRFGKGVLYREVLTDVCSKLKVDFDKQGTIEAIEHQLHMKLLTDSVEKMTEAERKTLLESLDISHTGALSGIAVVAALQAGVQLGGFAAYQLAVIVANSVAQQLLGHGLSFAANATLTKGLSIFAGPIGWVVMAAVTAVQIAGPAYRVTIPSVLQISFMRLKATGSTRADWPSLP